jgi:NAD(P)-dependent dehydrogenase (short-subunit alcohol dehydrogenase family)
MSERLAGKIALVTGIGAGIGRGCALMLARHGATVVGCDIDPATATATIETARAEGFDIDSVHPCDLTKPDDVQRFIDHAGKRHGRIDVLINAAAIAPHMAKIADMDYERQWSPTIVGELDLVFLACKAAWPYMVKSGRASIINFASVNAHRASLNFGMAAHCAGKAAVMAMTRQLAVEGGPFGIRANTIAPGMVETPATASAGALTGPVREAILSRVSIKRLGTPDDIAWCAVYLASDESAWVTGGNFPVDGGVTAV